MTVIQSERGTTLKINSNNCNRMQNSYIKNRNTVGGLPTPLT